MKHMSAIMREMADMMEGMAHKMNHGAMTKDQVMKNDAMIKGMKSQMSDL